MSYVDLQGNGKGILKKWIKWPMYLSLQISFDNYLFYNFAIYSCIHAFIQYFKYRH